MIEISVLIPQRNRGRAVAAQLPDVCRALDADGRPYEVIVVDDGSGEHTVGLLEGLLSDYGCLRVLQMSGPTGLSSALSTGIAAARGRMIVAIEAGECYPAKQIGTLLSRLVRADLVCGQRQRRGWAKAWQRVARIPRWLFLGLDTRDPECLFWAARKEAVQGIELVRGMYRYLPSLVAMRGYRVTELYVERRAATESHGDGWPNPGDLLCAWWLARRWQNYSVHELTADANKPRRGGRAIRIDAAQPTIAGTTAESFQHAEHRKSA